MNPMWPSPVREVCVMGVQRHGELTCDLHGVSETHDLQMRNLNLYYLRAAALQEVQRFATFLLHQRIRVREPFWIDTQSHVGKVFDVHEFIQVRSWDIGTVSAVKHLG